MNTNTQTYVLPYLLLLLLSNILLYRMYIFRHNSPSTFNTHTHTKSKFKKKEETHREKKTVRRWEMSSKVSSSNRPRFPEGKEEKDEKRQMHEFYRTGTSIFAVHQSFFFFKSIERFSVKRIKSFYQLTSTQSFMYQYWYHFIGLITGSLLGAWTISCGRTVVEKRS